MTACQLPGRIRGISLDLGNTLYALGPAEMSETVRSLHRFLEGRLCASLPYEELDRLYVEIRERQFAQNRATLCENDFSARVREMISRVHGPPSDALVVDACAAYGAGFIAALRLPPGMLETVQALHERYNGNLAVCSNFILSGPIRAVLARDDILPLLRGVVVSCDLGVVKPHPFLFRTVAEQLGMSATEVAHVGDDLDADIFGAKGAGMTTVYTTEFCGSSAADAVRAADPDFTIGRLCELVCSC